MPTITYKAKYRKNEGLVIAPTELLNLYLYGVNIVAGDGTEFSIDTVRYYIVQAQKEIENYLNIKLSRQLFEETLGYYHRDYNNGFPFFQTKYPANKVHSLIGLLGRAEQIIYPKEWLKTHVDSDGDYPKQFSLVPTGSGTGTSGNADVILTGIMRDVGLRSFGQIPSYWNTQYETGYDYDNIPHDIMNLVGKLASIGLFNIAGDLILGAGIASFSLSLDGLSQSISSTSSATNSGYGARIIQYQKEIKDTLSRIKLRYRGFNLVSM